MTLCAAHTRAMVIVGKHDCGKAVNKRRFHAWLVKCVRVDDVGAPSCQFPRRLGRCRPGRYLWRRVENGLVRLTAILEEQSDFVSQSAQQRNYRPEIGLHAANDPKM